MIITSLKPIIITAFLYFLKAYHQNLVYPRYVWIMYEDFLSPLDVPDDDHCTDEELATVLNGAIILQVINNSNVTSDNGIVS